MRRTILAPPSRRVSTDQRRHQYSEADRRDAVVRAFIRVRKKFVWDIACERFISRAAADEVLTAFNRQIEAAPVIVPNDQELVARMLTEVACADGDYGDAERRFIEGFVDQGDADDLVRRASETPLGPEELAGASAGPVRETMLLLAWALAYSDERLVEGEELKLAEFAERLNIEDSEVDKLKLYAQVHLIDNSLGHCYHSGSRDPEVYSWVLELAEKIGLPASEVEVADTRFRKRYGIADPG